MKHPPYHLRPNKSVDRFTLIELLRHFNKFDKGIKGYTYYGFGGPFLEDLRLIHKYLPEVKLVSIETNEETRKRQVFHKFTSEIKIIRNTYRDFITGFSSKGLEILWLDYTDFEISRIAEFQATLERLGPGSIIRITLRADFSVGNCPFSSLSQEQKNKFLEKVNSDFSAFISQENTTEDITYNGIPNFIQGIIRLSAEKTLDPRSGTVFLPLLSSYYTDSIQMLSVTGIVSKINDIEQIKSHFTEWDFSNTNWSAPEEINIPLLSTKERLLLEEHLPDGNSPIWEILKYKIENSQSMNKRVLKQYSRFNKYYPEFIRITP